MTNTQQVLVTSCAGVALLGSLVTGLFLREHIAYGVGALGWACIVGPYLALLLASLLLRKSRTAIIVLLAGGTLVTGAGLIILYLVVSDLKAHPDAQGGVAIFAILLLVGLGMGLVAAAALAAGLVEFLRRRDKHEGARARRLTR